MRGPSSEAGPKRPRFSLAESLDLVLPSLGAALVGPEAARRLHQISRVLVSSARAGLECRLDGGDSPVDLQQGISPARGEMGRLVDHLAALANGPLDHPAWKRLQQFGIAWSDPSSPLHTGITDLWLEIDVAGPMGETIVPSVFLCLDSDRRSPSGTLALAETALSLLMESEVPPALQENLRRCVHQCHGGARVSHLGMMLSRPTDGLRLNISHLPLTQFQPYLERIGWPGPGEHLYPLLFRLFEFVDEIRLCIDVGSRVYPSLGLECFPHQEHGLDPRWEPFLDELVQRGLCTPPKREALLSWHGYLTPAGMAAPWPESWLTESLVRPADTFGTFDRRLSHVKIAFSPQQPLAAKAYLGFGHLWAQYGAAQPAAATGRNGATISGDSQRGVGTGRSDREALSAAVTTAISFLIGTRNQGGWWRDFYDLNRGNESKGWISAFASDEWVTAYAGAALAETQDERAHEAACQAWNLLESRRGPQEGWGYHALLPVDADSTTWALRLAKRLAVAPSARLRHARRFLLRQMRPDGGIACYVAEECPRLARFLRMEGPYDGWCAVHTCVTAAAAVLDLGERPLRFLQSTQLEDGNWKGHWWEDDEYTTARAAEALALGAPQVSRDRVRRAVEWAARRIEPSGAALSAAHGGPSAFATALCVQILARADDPLQYQIPRERAVCWLIENQRPDGSWAPSARLRVPPPAAIDPEEHPAHTLVYLDRRRIFTTATALAALTMIHARSLRLPEV